MGQGPTDHQLPPRAGQRPAPDPPSQPQKEPALLTPWSWTSGGSTVTQGLQVVPKVKPQAGQRSLGVSRPQAPELSPMGEGFVSQAFFLLAGEHQLPLPTPWKNLGSEDRTQNARVAFPTDD